MTHKTTIFSNGWLALAALVALILSLGLHPGCSPEEAGATKPAQRPAACTGGSCASVPARGTATLTARTTYDDFQGATLSMEHGVVLDDGRVKNDWDLLFGNDRDAGRDTFSVNLVTDDRSFIVDLGKISLSAVPATVNPAAYAKGVRGEHDEVEVRLGHVYVVRTVDSDTVQLAVVKVIAHQLNHSVTLRWYRSAKPNRLVLPLADLSI